MPSQPGTDNHYNMQMSNFSFQKRIEPIDWKRLAAIDLDSISRNPDFNVLQDNILNVAFCSIESEIDVRKVDPNFLKLFKLAQLTIEYLLFSQDYLYGIINSNEEKLKTAVQEHDETKKELDKQKAAVEELKKESHKRKKMLIAQQHIMNQGSASYFKCMFCSKAFVNQSFLESHLSRRHPDMGPVPIQSMYQSHVQAPLTPHFQPVPADGATSTNNRDLEQQLHELQKRLLSAESQLLNERNSKNTPGDKNDTARQQDAVEKQIKNFEDTFRQEHQSEMERLEKMFSRQLKEAEEKRRLAEEKVEAMQRSRRGMVSSLGLMEDEEDLNTEKGLLREQREELAMLKEDMLQQRGKLEDQIGNKFKNQERKLKEQVESQQQDMKQEMNKMTKALEDALHLLNQEKNERHKLESERKQQADHIERLLQKPRLSAEKLKKPAESRNLTPHTTSSIEASPRSARQTKNDVTATPVMQIGDMEDDTETETDYANEDENNKDDADANETTELESTMASTGRGSTTPFGTGTMSPLNLSGTLKNKHLLADDIKNDPSVLGAIKEQLSEFLDDQLAERGIARGTTGIPDPEAERQLNSLKKERQQLAQDYPSFFSIRHEILKEVNEKAKEKHKAQAPPLPTPSPARPRVAAPSPKPSSNTPQLSRSGPRDPDMVPPASRSPVPRPAPRTSGGKLQSSMQSSVTDTQYSTTGLSTTMYSTGYDTTGMSYTQTGDSVSRTNGSNTERSASQWDSDDGEDEVDQVPQRLKPSARPNPKLAESLSDFDDDLSDKKHGPSKGSSGQKGSVSDIRRSLESKLQNPGKKPVGGVSVMKPIESRSKPSHTNDDIDDIFDEISSLEDDEPVRRRPRSQNRASSQIDTDKSSNTAVTSMWGGSSQGGTNRHTSGEGRSSLISVTDYDLSDELESY